MSTVLPTPTAVPPVGLAPLGCTTSVAPLSMNSSTRPRPTDSRATDSEDGHAAAVASDTARRHRVAEVRQQQGVSQRTLARRLGIDVKALQALEQPECDLTLSQLLAFQAALDVPLVDLIEECPTLSRPIAERAKMVKVMKTAVAMRQLKVNRRMERMAEMLCEQLVEVMPELAEVSGWPQFGSRRGVSALGKALSQPIDTSNLGLYE